VVVGYELANKLQPLWPHLQAHNSRAREIAARPVETGNEPSLNWVATESEDDWYRGRRRLGCQW
jgi:hypothetical protein